LAWVEVTSAVAGHARDGAISGELLDAVIHELDKDFRTSFEVLDIGSAVIVRSLGLVRAHGLRAADAIQLACALSAAAGAPPDSRLQFISSDTELNQAAEREGFNVLDPAQS